MFPNTTLPPEPVITRWGTWISAANYYTDNFDQIAEFVNQLNATDARCIRKAQRSFSNSRLKVDLAFIKNNFVCLVDAINKLESKSLLLNESLKIFTSVRKYLEKNPRKEFLNKYTSVLNKNEGLTLLSKISHVLEGNILSETDEFIDSMSPDLLAAYKFSPLTSCDVERSFSAYKRVLEDCRRKFTFDNLKKHVIIHCNKMQ